MESGMNMPNDMGLIVQSTELCHWMQTIIQHLYINLNKPVIEGEKPEEHKKTVETICPTCKRQRHPLVIEGMMDEEYAGILQAPQIASTNEEENLFAAK